MKVLLVYPQYPDTFWSFRTALKFASKKANFPPLGLLTVASMLPEAWQKKLVDMNVTSLTDEDLKWADYILISAMVVQKDSVDEVIARCNKIGTKIIAGGHLFTTRYEEFNGVDYFVLDEAEQLLKGEDTKSLLYDFARMKEQYNITIGLIFISNDSFFLSLLDDRIRSSLQAASIHFEKYTSSQLKDILKERAEYAFFDNVLEEEVIPLCAAHSSSLGDARMAIDVLLKAGRLAEKENSYKVKTSHVRRSFGQEKIIKNEVAENLSEKEKLILDIVGEKEVSTTEVYSKLKDKFAQRTLRKALALLQEKKLVCIRSLTDKKGSTRLVSKK